MPSGLDSEGGARRTVVRRLFFFGEQAHHAVGTVVFKLTLGYHVSQAQKWIPAFAGMTNDGWLSALPL
ncbi:hypothetical protein BH09GEM1_BH09GEM1_44560 [soil metagenome]